jgi:hypothetical protein
MLDAQIARLSALQSRAPAAIGSLPQIFAEPASFGTAGGAPVRP